MAYEASYIGFALRDLADKGLHCDVVAPSSIPKKGGKAVKTDRIDAAPKRLGLHRNLFQFGRGLVTRAPDFQSCRYRRFRSALRRRH